MAMKEEKMAVKKVRNETKKLPYLCTVRCHKLTYDMRPIASFLTQIVEARCWEKASSRHTNLKFNGRNNCVLFHDGSATHAYRLASCLLEINVSWVTIRALHAAFLFSGFAVWEVWVLFFRPTKQKRFVKAHFLCFAAPKIFEHCFGF